MSLNFVVYDKQTGAIREQRSASGCFTEDDIMFTVYGTNSTQMLGFLGAISMLDQVNGNGSMMVDIATKTVIPNPDYVKPVAVDTPVL